MEQQHPHARFYSPTDQYNLLANTCVTFAKELTHSTVTDTEIDHYNHDLSELRSILHRYNEHINLPVLKSSHDKTHLANAVDYFGRPLKPDLETNWYGLPADTALMFGTALGNAYAPLPSLKPVLR